MKSRFRYILFLLPALAAAAATGPAHALPCGDFLMPAAQLKTVGRGYAAGHGGIDLVAPRGTPVRAAGSGRVIFAGRYSGYGNMVDLQHPDGTVTRYGHLAAFAPGLQPGLTVGAGRVLGSVGSTGFTTGPHLHFEVRVNGRPIDPKPALALAGCTPATHDPVEEARAPDRR